MGPSFDSKLDTLSSIKVLVTVWCRPSTTDGIWGRGEEVPLDQATI